jgi:hypothetical protein
MTEEVSFPCELHDWDVEAARADLADRLTGLRAQPGFPRGADTDILSMSLPPYYSACPNPYLADWVAATDPAVDLIRSRKDPGPFTTDVSVGKGHPFYKAHSYPTKVPHAAIMRFLLHYTEPGDVVLDGFCGTGMTGVAAQACGQPEGDLRREIEAEMGQVRWGYRRAVLADLSPSATFIAAGLNLPIDADAFDRRSAEILEAFEAEWGWMYRTTDEKGREGIIDYVVWSEVFTCPACAGAVVFYDVAFNSTSGQVRDTFRCLSCNKELNKDGLERRKVPVRTLVGGVIERIEFRPVAIHYRVGRGRKVKVPDADDVALLRRIGNLPLPGPVPTNDLPIASMYHGSRLAPKGFTRLHHLWGDRALVALAALWAACSNEPDPVVRCALLFWMEQSLWGLSWMNIYKATAYSQVNRYQTGVYYVGSLVSECSVRYNLEGSMPKRGKRQALVNTWRRSPARLGQVAISTGSSTALSLPNDSVDYVFVDPPFGSNIYYADQAHVVESWHRVVTDRVEEAIVNETPKASRSLAEYGVLMERCFAEFGRVLKPGRWMTIEFSNPSNEVWLTVQASLARAGFIVADTRIIDKQHLSYRQVTASNAVKRDLIISSYKPTAVLAERLAPVAGTPDSAWEFVREHLRHLPMPERVDGSLRVVRERMPDRLWDRMGAFHVQRQWQIPVTASEFYAGLDQRFPERDGMYFLSEQVEAYERQRLSIKELVAAELFITNESSAVQWLRQFLKSRRSPQPYDRIQPDYFRELETGLPDWEDLPDLKELLEENFVTDDEGRWYVPDPRKATDLEKLRRRALLREFATYTQGRAELKRFRSEAVRAGFSDAWDRRDFATIVAVGQRLPDDAFTEDPTLLYYVDNAQQLQR